ncbi:MAG: hypothetical protein LBN04_08170 [Oscillospiraceae bacterium]|nr:hypothetical protein [Oscillospiraceae bacterium]
MALRKCPRCELNYILDDGALCTICREEVRGKRGKEDTAILCSVCGEVPALPGEDMCKACLTEFKSIDRIDTDDEDTPADPVEIDPDPVSGLDEIEGVDALEEAVPDDEAQEDASGSIEDV